MFQTLRNLILVFAICAIGYAGFDAFGTLRALDDSTTTYVSREDQPSQSSAGFSNQLELEPGYNGQYWVVAEVEGVEIRFLIDTGASHVVLSPEDAESLGYDDSTLDYTQVFQTANGHTRAAPIVLDGIRIGQLEIDDVAAAVNESNMGASLLGMTFLRQLDGYQVEDGKLILYW